MNRLLLIGASGLLYLAAGQAVAQGRKPAAPAAKAQHPPQYPGGEAALNKLIADSLMYPDEALFKKVQGRVVVQFEVDTLGNTLNVQVAEGVNPYLDAEAVRLAGLLRGWEPARLNGRKVVYKYKLPVTFRLGSGTPPAAPARKTGRR